MDDPGCSVVFGFDTVERQRLWRAINDARSHRLGDCLRVFMVSICDIHIALFFMHLAPISGKDVCDFGAIISRGSEYGRWSLDRGTCRLLARTAHES